jgi:hypothetical protein
MTVMHVVTVADDLPLHVFDKLMTATEHALRDLGATRVWVDPSLPPHAVMAEMRNHGTSREVVRAGGGERADARMGAPQPPLRTAPAAP